jgi:Zn-dependent peptidase ImmA (M78 family)
MNKLSINEVIQYMTNSMIEAQAIQDLCAYQKAIGKRLTYPIYADEVIQTVWGVDVEYVDDLQDKDGKAILACFSPHERKVHVNTSEKGTEGRMSFTLAHEAGHVSIHDFLSRTTNIDALCRGSFTEGQEAVAIERQADKYAAYLLMPATAVNEKIEELGYKAGTTIDLMALGKNLKNYFGVSSQALEKRLTDLGINTTGAFYQAIPKKVHDDVFEKMEKDREGWVV